MAVLVVCELDACSLEFFVVELVEDTLRNYDTAVTDAEDLAFEDG